MIFDIITTVPEMIRPVVSESIIGRALSSGIVCINTIDLRDFTHDRHRTVDDSTYGGGPGMLIKCEPVFEAVESVVQNSDSPLQRVLLMTPQGKRFDQRLAEELSRENHLVLVCGRYEGFDERIRQHLATDEISVGDYVVTGGELAALVVIDAVCRLLPGVLGDDNSSQSESHSGGLLEYPQYTRPYDFRGWKVPDVLLSGNHALIEQWREQSALVRTYRRRPDMLSEEDRRRAELLLDKFDWLT